MMGNGGAGGNMGEPRYIGTMGWGGNGEKGPSLTWECESICGEKWVVKEVEGRDVTSKDEKARRKNNIERLTYRSNKENGVCVAGINGANVFEKMKEIANLLAAYEDTGLTPEEIMGLCEMDKRSRMAKMLHWEENEQDGRLVVLPCKVGATVWYITPTAEICRAEVTGIWLNVHTNPQMWLEIKYQSNLTGGQEYKSRVDLMLGKTVFLTREEAEAALK